MTKKELIEIIKQMHVILALEGYEKAVVFKKASKVISEARKKQWLKDNKMS